MRKKYIASIRDVAQAAGVSPATASRIFITPGQVKQMQSDAADAKAGVVSPEVQAQKNAAIAAMRASEPTPAPPPAAATASKPQ
jgi:hypothetical protein